MSVRPDKNCAMREGRLCLCSQAGAIVRMATETFRAIQLSLPERGLPVFREDRLDQFAAIARPRRMGMTMTNEKQPVTIKKYANRRLYNTGASAYVTLGDLAEMVKAGEDFVVFDAKSGEDITRSVLGQIIFEQEGKTGQNLLADSLPATIDPLLWGLHADARPELSRVFDRASGVRQPEVPRAVRRGHERQPARQPRWPIQRGRCSRPWRSRRARTWPCFARLSTCSRLSAQTPPRPPSPRQWTN